MTRNCILQLLIIVCCWTEKEERAEIDSRESRREVFWKILMTADRPSWEASTVLKSSAIFIAVWLHVLPRSTLIVSHSVEATKLQAFQYTQTVALFFFFCREQKIIASFSLALKTQPCVFCTVWSYFGESTVGGKWKMAAEWSDRLPHHEASVCVQLHRRCTNVVVK